MKPRKVMLQFEITTDTSLRGLRRIGFVDLFGSDDEYIDTVRPEQVQVNVVQPVVDDGRPRNKRKPA